jgi:hypothetical protein
MIRLSSESSRNESAGLYMGRAREEQRTTSEAEQRNVVVVGNQ